MYELKIKQPLLYLFRPRAVKKISKVPRFFFIVHGKDLGDSVSNSGLILISVLLCTA